MNDVTRDDINSLAGDIFDLKTSIKYILQDIIDDMPIDTAQKQSLLSSVRNL